MYLFYHLIKRETKADSQNEFDTLLFPYAKVTCPTIFEWGQWKKKNAYYPMSTKLIAHFRNLNKKIAVCSINIFSQIR